MIKYLSALILIFSLTSASSQELWDLEKCVNFALENNLDVRRAALNVQTSETNVTQSKTQFLPSVNASAYYGYNFGQRIDPFTNQFAQNTVNTGNFNLSANWVLFSGLQNYNRLTQSKYDKESSEFAYRNVQYLTSLAVTTSYLQILFNSENLKVAQEQMEVTKLQVERTEKLVAAGSAPKGSLYDIEAQYAREEQALVEADNQVVLAYLSLKQLLRIPGDLNMQIVEPTVLDTASLQLPTSLDAVIQTAYDSYPSIKSTEYSLLSAEKQVQISNAAIVPRLSFNGSVGTGYSGNATTVTGSSLVTAPIGYVLNSNETVVSDFTQSQTEKQGFGDQVETNFNQSVGLSLSIPIFNQWNNKSNINRAKINVDVAQNALDQEKQKVRQDIEQAYANASAAFKKYRATEKGLTALQEAFNYAQKRFDVGMINGVDYNVAKTNLYRAQSDLVQAKYDYIFRIKILDFYQGKSLTL